MSTIKILDDRIKYYYNDELHRTDGPAVICSNGTKEWVLNGLRHREDGPAVIYFNGNQEWWVDDFCISSKYTFEDDVTVYNSVEYQLNGKFHRFDGPAVEYTIGIKEWIQYGKMHRENGPAVERKNGLNEYWFCGIRYSIDDYYKLLKLEL